MGYRREPSRSVPVPPTRPGAVCGGRVEIESLGLCPNGLSYSESVMRVVDVIKAINCRCKSVRWIKQYVPWPTDIVGGGGG
ncbi:hypothetical protein EVAR_99249_1 [Eumeta japonica]|uniref:Uncharacterized protein n=1 Tax=Eumeta variegata TaxID=151549 RepID=A0A4C2A264_EUMVA|nr:hypothetical protein EVAR_99249_1 [Eumeta japonica]